jgi:HSP20 family protein
MHLIPWRPGRGWLGDEFDDEMMLPMVFKMGMNEPAMDIYEKGKEVVAELNIPGYDPDKIHISVENGFLRVSGAMAETKEEKDKGYWRREISRGSFERMSRLPVPVEENKIKADYEQGILRITLPKRLGKEAKKPVPVKAKREKKVIKPKKKKGTK